MSIDFRNKKFNEEIAHQMSVLRAIFEQKRILVNVEEELIQRLNNLWESLQKYYSKHPDYSEEKGLIRANEVFSEYLQNTMYYITHNTKDQIFAQKLMLTILNHHEFPFFYVSHYNSKKEVITWTDPKEEFTALTSAAYNGQDAIVEKIMNLAIKAFDQDQVGLSEYFLRANKIGCSALFSAASALHTTTVALLIEYAKKILTKENFKSLLMAKNKNMANILHRCVRDGDVKLVSIIIQFAREVMDKQELRDLLESRDENGYTPYLSAISKNSYEIVNALNELAIEAYGEDRESLGKYLLIQTREGYSAFISASKCASLEILKKVLRLAKHAFKGNREGMNIFLNQINNLGYSAFHVAIFDQKAIDEEQKGIDKKRKKLIKKLIKSAKKFYAEDNLGLLKFLYQKQMYDYTTLMTAAEKGNVAILKLLLVALKKAEPNRTKFSMMLNEQWKNGDTAVNIAVRKEMMEAYDLLVDFDANIHIANDSRFSAADNFRRLKMGFFEKKTKGEVSTSRKREIDEVDSKNSIPAKRKK